MENNLKYKNVKTHLKKLDKELSELLIEHSEFILHSYTTIDSDDNKKSEINDILEINDTFISAIQVDGNKLQNLFFKKVVKEFTNISSISPITIYYVQVNITINFILNKKLKNVGYYKFGNIIGSFDNDNNFITISLKLRSPGIATLFITYPDENYNTFFTVIKFKPFY